VGGFLPPTVEKMALAVFFLAVGIVVAAFSYTGYRTSLASKTWPSVTGSIIQSEIERQTSTSGEGANKKTTVKEYPKIAYQYHIDGQRYKSANISFLSSSGGARQVVSRYPHGKTVPVYYNPDKPEQAVLVPGSPEFNYVPYFFSVFFVLLGLILFGRWRKQTRALGDRF
jgi:hypothetical protein